MNDNLQTMIEENRVIRRAWRGHDAQGRETACLLAAMSPAVVNSAAQCPADVMPAWLAYLTPWIDDAGTIDHWPAVVRAYADVAARWHVLDAAAWRRLDYECRAIAVREAATHTTDAAALAACATVIALCERVIAGDEPTESEWSAARAAAASARAATHTTDAAALAACETVIALCERVIAGDEPTQREWAAAAEAAEAEASAAWAAWAWAADRMIDAMLSAIARECAAREAT
jgi:hypothetical protein